MREIERYLSRDEEVVFGGRKHPSVMYRRAVAFALAVILGSAAGFMFNPSRGDDVIDKVAGGLVVLIAIRFFFGVARWRAERIALTQRRLVVTSGLLKKEVTSIPLNRIRNVTLSRTLGARLQRFGDVVVDVGDYGVFEIRRIPRVKEFYRLIVEEMSENPKDPLPRSKGDDEDTGELPRVVL